MSVDDEFRVFVVDAARFRVQVYRKTFKELTPRPDRPGRHLHRPQDQLGSDNDGTRSRKTPLKPGLGDCHREKVRAILTVPVVLR